MRKQLHLLLALLLALPIGVLAQGTTWQTATLINSGGSGTATLNDKQGDAWFRIEVPSDGVVTLTQTLSGDLRMYNVYFDYSDGNEVHGRSSTGYYPENGQSLEVANVGKGTYYIQVVRNSGSGTCKLSYRFTANSYTNDAEPNDEAGLGATLTNGQTVQGHLGYVDGTNYCDNDDWYKIEVTQDGRVDLVYDCDQTYNLELYKIFFCRYRESDGQYPERASTGYYVTNDTLTVTNVGVGTYYIHMNRNKGHGGYKLKYIFTPNSYQNDAEPNDEAGTGATLINGQTVQGHLGYVDGKDYVDHDDWYKIEVTQDGRVDLVYDCDQTYNLELYKIFFCRYRESDGQYPERASTGYYVTNDTLTVTNVGVGTYYIHMNRNKGHGGYKLKYVFTPCKHQNDSEPNDVAGQGSEIAVGQAVQGHLGYVDGNDQRDTDDWYKVVVPRDGRVQIIYNCDQTYNLELYRVDFCWYRESDGGYPVRAATGYYVKNDTLTINDVAAGTYYVHLNRNNGHGGYILKYVFTPNQYRPDIEPNNELAEVKQVLGIDKYLTGHLGYLNEQDERDTNDWFQLDTNSSTASLTVTVEAEPSSTLEFYRVNIVMLKDGKTSVVTNSGYYIHDPVTLTVKEVDPDATYYVHLNRNNGHGGYTIIYGTSEHPQPNDPTPDEPVVTQSDPSGNVYTTNPADGKTTLTEVVPDGNGNVNIETQPKNSIPAPDIIKKGAFDNVGDVKDVTVTQMTPPDFEDPNELIGHNPQGGTLHVPAGTGEVYRQHPVWSQFGKIVEEGQNEPQPTGDIIDEFTLWYTLDIGGTVAYKLSEKPQVRLLGAETTVTSSRGVATFKTDQIWKFTLGASAVDPSVGIDEAVAPVQPEAEGSVNRSDDALVFSGCRPGSPVLIYTAGGRMVEQHRIGSDGSLELSLGSLSRGLYIVKAGSVNIKFLKK